MNLTLMNKGVIFRFHCTYPSHCNDDKLIVSVLVRRVTLSWENYKKRKPGFLYNNCNQGRYYYDRRMFDGLF